MAVLVGSARSDENGKAYNGKAGDQKSGKEVSTQNWYKHSKGWRVFRAKSARMAQLIARAMRSACVNDKIGYDQWNRNTLYTQAAKVDFDPGRVTIACETDCSALVRVCCAFAGIKGIPADFRTGNMPTYLMATGQFVELKGSKYTDQSSYLGEGDILVTKTSGHTVVVLTDGPKYEGSVQAKEYNLGERILREGDEGTDVKVLQENLIALGYDLGKWGADGDFGDATELAVMKFQRDHKCEDDGEYGPITHKAMLAALDAAEESTGTTGRTVRVVNGDCWVRTAPSTTGRKLGVAKNGTSYTYEGETAANGWHLIAFDNQNGWVSGKYSTVEE